MHRILTENSNSVALVFEFKAPFFYSLFTRPLDFKGFGYGIVSANSEYTNTISARYYKDGSD
jgi:hypothetical protein